MARLAAPVVVAQHTPQFRAHSHARAKCAYKPHRRIIDSACAINQQTIFVLSLAFHGPVKLYPPASWHRGIEAIVPQSSKIWLSDVCVVRPGSGTHHHPCPRTTRRHLQLHVLVESLRGRGVSARSVRPRVRQVAAMEHQRKRDDSQPTQSPISRALPVFSSRRMLRGGSLTSARSTSFIPGGRARPAGPTIHTTNPKLREHISRATVRGAAQSNLRT